MIKENIKAALWQGHNGENEALFREYMRYQIRETLVELMQEEVTRLCGPKHHPMPGAAYRRGGSEKGVAYLGGRRQTVVRPRERWRGKDGVEREVVLRSYQSARKVRHVEADVAECIAHGMSTRSFTRMRLEGLSSSEVSRRWVRASVKKIQELRERDLRGERFFGLILDGVFLTREIVVLVAIGLCCDGRKLVLDFEVGSSENLEVARELTRRLIKRGFTVKGRLLAIIDGAAALEKAVLESWSGAEIQRCLVHKERNLQAHLRRKDHAECSRLMDRLRRAEGEVAGREALGELKGFVATRSQEALQSLEEAGDRLITLHRLNVPSTLNRSLLSTNLIENLLRNYRRQTERVCRWRSQSDQVSRWTATALLWAEEGFRKITGHKDLPHLLRALGFPLAPLPEKPSALDPGGFSPARSVPASWHTPCSPANVSQSGLSTVAFLPPREVGGKNALSQLDLHPNLQHL